jgi:hypothetical protein
MAEELLEWFDTLMEEVEKLKNERKKQQKKEHSF